MASINLLTELNPMNLGPYMVKPTAFYHTQWTRKSALLWYWKFFCALYWSFITIYFFFSNMSILGNMLCFLHHWLTWVYWLYFIMSWGTATYAYYGHAPIPEDNDLYTDFQWFHYASFHLQSMAHAGSVTVCFFYIVIFKMTLDSSQIEIFSFDGAHAHVIPVLFMVADVMIIAVPVRLWQFYNPALLLAGYGAVLWVFANGKIYNPEKVYGGQVLNFYENVGPTMNLLIAMAAGGGLGGHFVFWLLYQLRFFLNTVCCCGFLAEEEPEPEVYVRQHIEGVKRDQTPRMVLEISKLPLPQFV